MRVRPLQSTQPATVKGDLPSQELVEVIQRLTGAVTVLQDRLDALGDVAAPVGGATIDAEARTAINAIRGV